MVVAVTSVMVSQRMAWRAWGPMRGPVWRVTPVSVLVGAAWVASTKMVTSGTEPAGPVVAVVLGWVEGVVADGGEGVGHASGPRFCCPVGGLGVGVGSGGEGLFDDGSVEGGEFAPQPPSGLVEGRLDDEVTAGVDCLFVGGGDPLLVGDAAAESGKVPPGGVGDRVGGVKPDQFCCPVERHLALGHGLFYLGVGGVDDAGEQADGFWVEVESGDDPVGQGAASVGGGGLAGVELAQSEDLVVAETGDGCFQSDQFGLDPVGRHPLEPVQPVTVFLTRRLNVPFDLTVCDCRHTSQTTAEV